MSDKLLKKIKDENIKFVDLRFTDPKGKMQHVTFHSDLVDEDLFKAGSFNRQNGPVLSARYARGFL